MPAPDPLFDAPSLHARKWASYSGDFLYLAVKPGRHGIIGKVFFFRKLSRELTQARLKHFCPLPAFQFHEKMFAHGETYLKENVEEL